MGNCLVTAQAKAGPSVCVRLRGVEKELVNGVYVNVSELASRNADVGNDQYLASTLASRSSAHSFLIFGQLRRSEAEEIFDEAAA